MGVAGFNCITEDLSIIAMQCRMIRVQPLSSGLSPSTNARNSAHAKHRMLRCVRYRVGECVSK